MFGRSINFTSKLYVARYQAALWIAENSSPDTIFAAWNTGQLSFFSNRVLRGSIPLSEYLSENKVDYIVDYHIYDSIPEFPVVQTFPINDGSGQSIQIWQVTPPVSSTQ
jgi:hypothetical protein